jgi:hypothetical protein
MMADISRLSQVHGMMRFSSSSMDDDGGRRTQPKAADSLRMRRSQNPIDEDLKHFTPT